MFDEHCTKNRRDGRSRCASWGRGGDYYQKLAMARRSHLPEWGFYYRRIAQRPTLQTRWIQRYFMAPIVKRKGDALPGLINRCRGWQKWEDYCGWIGIKTPIMCSIMRPLRWVAVFWALPLRLAWTKHRYLLRHLYVFEFLSLLSFAFLWGLCTPYCSYT